MHQSSGDGKGPTTPEQALHSARVMWMALLAGPVLFLIVVISTDAAKLNGSKDVADLLLYINLGMLAIQLVVGFVVRASFYRKSMTDEGLVSPQGYVGGNMVLWAMCEGAALFSVVICMLAGVFVPYVIPMVIASAVHVATFPTGAAMRPSDEPWGRRE